MATQDKSEQKSENGSSREDSPGGGIFRAGRDIRAGRDLAGRDVVGGDVVGRDSAGRDIQSSSEWIAALTQWQLQIEARIEAQKALSPDEKKDLKDQVAKIQGEAAKGRQADQNRLEKLINTLGVMGPDIFEVAVATLVNPLAGIGLVVKKIGDKAKLESKPS